MKIIKLLLLLTFGLWADFKLDVPNDVNVSQLENIVNNGWNDSNLTLNKWVVSNAQRVMPEILEKIKKPILEVESTDDNLFPTPKLLLGKDDVLLIVAYTKYLERYNKLEEAMKINIKILKGLNNIKDKSMLSLMVRMVFENTVVDSVEQYIDNLDIGKMKSKKLYENINTLLAQTSEGFFAAMEREKSFLSKFAYKELLARYINQDFSMNYKYLMEDVIKKLRIYNDDLYGKMFTAMKIATPEAMKSFEDKIKLERKESMGVVSNVKFFLSGAWVRIKSLLGIEIRDFGYVSERMARQLVCVATPKINQIYLDYLQHIEKNKKLIKKLEIINKPF